ncbi:major facilitator superfamily domain-containing protein [Leucosporidium creatinivorum]|uniref:Major facilitator superfamily domain-containing protein n=1 Tax=Leucosporidium creatinivorum TaxID=106004 RepID=A0A1Y2G2P8_9BASI|nr:major facilitator superfamily domain-containing protein [Leucosporidium creatinivorum]
MQPGLPAHLNTPAYRRGMLKVDFYVTGVVLLLYLFAFLDKANLGNARVAGLQRDLGLSSTQWSLVLTALYPPYMFSEIPVNLMLKRIGPHILLPALTLSFGIVCTFQGFVTSYGGLVACRVMLGLAEGGLLCGIVLYMSTFYPRYSFQLRCVFLFSATSLAGAFSGLLAAAISKLDGHGGKPGWAWIFFLEGAATCIFAIAAFFLMAPSYEKAWWLKQEEKEALRAGYNSSGRGEEHDAHFTWAEVFSTFKSPFMLMMLPVFWSNGLILFGLAYFAPTIVGTFGYSPIQTQLHSVPPYAVVFVVAVISSYYSDKHGIRGWNLVVFGGIGLIGYAINIATSNRSARYAALFLQAFAGYAPSPVLSSWLVDNTAPFYKRGTAIGASYMATQIGAIISTWIYPTVSFQRRRCAFFADRDSRRSLVSSLSRSRKRLATAREPPFP